jgi:aerobic-type carbon monoxide dehydrogenase small subunit (CoxS/CutS family)
MDSREERISRNEILFREINERLKDVQDGFDSLSEQADFVCECGNATCTGQITMSLAAYEALRSDATLFAVLPGHEVPTVEEVVDRRGAYHVVRKAVGEPAQMAREEDPRS